MHHFGPFWAYWGSESAHSRPQKAQKCLKWVILCPFRMHTMGMPSPETIFLTVTLGIWVREIGAIMPFTGTPKMSTFGPLLAPPLDPSVYWWHVHIPWCLFIEGMGIPAYHTVYVLLVGIGTPPKTCHFVTWSSRDERIHYYYISWCNELYRVL